MALINGHRPCNICNNNEGQVYLDMMWASENPKGPTCGRVYNSVFMCKLCLDHIVHGSGSI